MADARLGLATAPVILSLDERPALLELVAKRRCAGKGELETALRWVKEGRGVERTQALAEERAARATDALEVFAPSRARDALADLARLVVERER
jgi:geranylgeranyl pyrophosphate synthase